jgi:hypothetical protein
MNVNTCNAITVVAICSMLASCFLSDGLKQTHPVSATSKCLDSCFTTACQKRCAELFSKCEVKP